MNIIANAFSLQMIDTEVATSIQVEPVSVSEIPKDLVSAIGHADTANVVSEILGQEIQMNRINVKLTGNDVLYVAQIVGGRLPEGATTLPEGFEIRFLKVKLS